MPIPRGPAPSGRKRGHHRRVVRRRGQRHGAHQHLVEAGLAWRSWPIWSTTSSIVIGRGHPVEVLADRPEGVDDLDLVDDVEVTAPLPAEQGHVAEGLQPGAELGQVRRTPLATARTLPFCSVIRVTMRSASPSRMVRSTTPRSRKRVISARAVLGARRRSSAGDGPLVPGGRRGGAVGPGRAGARPGGGAPPTGVAGDEATSTGGTTTRGATAVNPATAISTIRA